MTALVIHNVQHALHNIMHHRAYCSHGSSDQKLHSAGRAFAASLIALGISQEAFYKATFNAAKESIGEWAEWHHTLADMSVYGNMPVPPFAWVEVMLRDETVIKDVLANEVDWLSNDDKAVSFYRINNNPDNFWVEVNTMIGYEYHEEPSMAIEPEHHQRVRVRYGNAFRLNAEKNAYVYWSKGYGWVNRFGFQMHNVRGWQPLTEQELIDLKVEQFLYEEKQG